MSPRLVVVHPDAAVLAEAVAARLLTRILDVQAVRSPAHVVLTGGTIGIATLAAAARHPLIDAIDWTGVHLWWGDERFLPAGDPERNETQARSTLLDHLPALPVAHIHPIPAPGAVIDTPAAAAVAYAAELAAHATTGVAGGPNTVAVTRIAGAVETAVPAFDVMLLGVGPDGHIASLFPGHGELAATGTTAGVMASPKPPPQRVTLTFGALCAAREVWLVAAGAEKADAVGRALRGDDPSRTPAAGVSGRGRTLWLIDRLAAQAG